VEHNAKKSKNYIVIAKYKGMILRGRKWRTQTSLYLDIHINGKRQHINLGLSLIGDKEKDTETIIQAEKKMADMRQELNLMDEDSIDINKSKTNIVDFFQIFIDEKDKQGKGKSKRYKNTLIYIKSLAGDTLPFNKINTFWLESFKNHLSANVKRNSAATYYETLKAVLNKAVKQGYIKSNPCDKVDNVKRVSTKRDFLDIEDIKKLDITPCDNEVVKRAFFFSCFTGLRISDIKALTWGEISKKEIHFSQKKTTEFTVLPISKQAMKYLGKRGANDEKVFDLLSEDYIRKQIIKWVEAAEINKKITFHNARHTFATLALTNDVDLYTVSKLLGHTNIKNTQIYAKLIDKKREEAVNKLPTF